MIKKTINFVDFNGNHQEETLYFNLTEPEVVRLDVKFEGGLEAFINTLDAESQPGEILTLFELILKESYGEKTEDGKHFVKDPEKVNLFIQSAAYSALFMELVTDAEKAAAFFNALLSSTTISGNINKKLKAKPIQPEE